MQENGHRSDAGFGGRFINALYYSQNKVQAPPDNVPNRDPIHSQ